MKTDEPPASTDKSDFQIKVNELSQEIALKFQYGETLKLNNLLADLTLLCSRIPGDRFSRLCSQLCPERMMELLLTSPGVRQYLSKSSSICWELTHQIMKVPNLSSNLGQSLSSLFELLPKESATTLCDELLRREDLNKFPLKLLHKVIQLNPTELHRKVIRLYTHRVDEETFTLEMSPWPALSSQSPLIFQHLTSTLNTLLVHVKLKKLMLSYVRAFIDGVRNEAKWRGVDLVSLYPSRLQPLVSLLTIDWSSLKPVEASNLNPLVSAIVTKLRQTAPLQLFTALSHFKTHDAFASTNSNHR